MVERPPRSTKGLNVNLDDVSRNYGREAALHLYIRPIATVSSWNSTTILRSAHILWRCERNSERPCGNSTISWNRWLKVMSNCWRGSRIVFALEKSPESDCSRRSTNALRRWSTQLTGSLILGKRKDRHPRSEPHVSNAERRLTSAGQSSIPSSLVGGIFPFLGQSAMGIFIRRCNWEAGPDGGPRHQYRPRWSRREQGRIGRLGIAGDIAMGPRARSSQ